MFLVRSCIFLHKLFGLGNMDLLSLPLLGVLKSSSCGSEPPNPALYSNPVFTPDYQQDCMDSDAWRWPPLSGVDDVTLTADWSWRLSVTLLHECNIIEIERTGVSVECRVQWDDGVLEKKVLSSVNLNIVGNIRGNFCAKLNKPIHKKF